MRSASGGGDFSHSEHVFAAEGIGGGAAAGGGSADADDGGVLAVLC